ncbi:MAG: T9SS type A sorting domain-containing protein [Bacteroidetes bacterium]|nr:T9SS type A sorting domain-containing protein [Bacteroidota bacterium]
MKKILLFTCLLTLNCLTLLGQTQVNINTIAQHFNSPFPSDPNSPNMPEDGVDYQRNNALCNGGYGEFIVTGSSFYSLDGASTILQISAYKNNIQVVNWTNIPYQQDYTLFVPADDANDYEIRVRKASVPNEYAVMASGFYIENGQLTVTANTSAIINHPGCAGNDGSLGFSGIDGGGNEQGTLQYTIYHTTNASYVTLDDGAFTDLEEGDYRLYVYDGGITTAPSTDPGEENTYCMFYIDTYTLTRNIGFTAGTPATTNIVCKGDDNGTLSITPSPANTDYVLSLDGTNWSAAAATPVLEDLEAGLYNNVRLARTGDLDCYLTLSAVTIQEPADALSVSGTSSTDCQLTATGAGGWSNYTYRLSPTGSWVTGATFTDLEEGDYTIYVKDDQGCEAQSSATVSVTCTPTARTAATGTHLSVYPNPTQGSFRLNASQLNASTARVELMDILGKVVSQQQVAITGAAFQLDMAAPAPGIYFVRVTANGQQYLQRVVRN